MTNLLYIFADQLQAFTLGCMGHRVVKTPHLDALAADGVLFRQTYSNAPVCTPFRGTLMSGRYPSQTGCRSNNDGLPDDSRCIAHALNDAGLVTSYVGKWHLYATGNVAVPEEHRCGFQRFAGYQAFNEFWDDVVFFDEQHEPIRYDIHRTDATADLAIRRMQAVADRPFAQFVSFQNPHYPLQPAPAFEAMYTQAEPEFRDNVRDCDVFTPTFSPRSPRPVERDPNYQRYGRSLVEFHRMYYAMVSQLDFAVGKIIRALKAMGQYDQTVIVFTSDHGEMAGSHGMMNKGVAYEESSRIPMIVRVPDGLRSVVRDEVVCGLDLNPAMLTWLDAPPEPHFAGRDIAALATDESPGEDAPVFAELGNWQMVRAGDWKLIANRDTQSPTELFNLAADPCELHNLVDASDAAPCRAELSELLNHWRTEVGANEGTQQ
jgi:arylsulfatase A-like enzyme